MAAPNASRDCRQQPDTHKLQQGMGCSKLLYIQKKFNDETMTASSVGDPPIPELKRPWQWEDLTLFQCSCTILGIIILPCWEIIFLVLCVAIAKARFFFPPNAWQKESVQLQRKNRINSSFKMTASVFYSFTFWSPLHYSLILSRM